MRFHAVRAYSLRLGLGLAGLFAGLVSAPARASLPDLVGLGTRGPALGDTGTAYLNGYEAVYQNPAGLLFCPKSLSVGVVYGDYGVHLDGAPHQIDSTSGLLLGAVLPLPLGGVLRDRLSLGFGFYFPFSVVNQADAPFPGVPRAALIDDRTQVISVLVGVAARLPKNFSLGVSVLALAGLVGQIQLSPDGSGSIGSATQEQVTVDYAPIVGLRWHDEAGRLKLGAVFRGTSQSTYQTTVTSQLGNIVPISLPVITIMGVAQFDPLQAAVEGSYALGSQVTLIANLTWKHWSAFANPVQPATDGAPALPPTDYHDTAVPRVAVEWQPPWVPAGALALRLGYFFEMTPAPPDSGGETMRSLLDASRHVVSAGLGYHLPRGIPVDLSAFFQWHQLAGSERLTGGFGIGGASVGLEL